jgi:hypothetical protein
MMAKQEAAPEVAAPTVALTFDQIKELIAAGSQGGRSTDEILALAKAVAKEQDRSNPTHPAISEYSRPRGERDDPKGPMRCKMTWGGTQLHGDLLTAEEFDLVHQVPVGAYRITRPDGSKFTVHVVGTTNESTGKPERLDFNFATKGKLKDGLPSMVAMLREMLAQATSSAASLAG